MTPSTPLLAGVGRADGGGRQLVLLSHHGPVQFDERVEVGSFAAAAEDW